MADASNSVYEYDSVFRGHHIYGLHLLMQVVWEDSRESDE